MASRLDLNDLQELYLRIPAHVAPLADVPDSHKLILGAVWFLRDMCGETAPTRRRLAELTGKTKDVVSHALSNWHRRGELRLSPTPTRSPAAT